MKCSSHITIFFTVFQAGVTKIIKTGSLGKLFEWLKIKNIEEKPFEN